MNVLAEMIGYQYLDKMWDDLPHNMNFNVSTSISNVQRGQFIDMYIGNPEDHHYK